MPTVIIDGYKFRFYSSDINECKIWLQPVVVEYNNGYNQAELNRILKLTRKNQTKLLENWNDHFSQ